MRKLQGMFVVLGVFSLAAAQTAVCGSLDGNPTACTQTISIDNGLRSGRSI